MKRLSALLLSLFLLCSLCACTGAQTQYTVEKNGETFAVDPVRGTITDGIHTYRYTFSGDASSYEIRITYPNGAVYYWSHSGRTGHGGWSDDYDEHAYADGNILCDVIAAGAPKPVHTGKILAAILLLIIGAINAAFPRTAWTLQYGWRYKNAEPSGFAIGWNRVIGFLAVLISVFLFFS